MDVAEVAVPVTSDGSVRHGGAIALTVALDHISFDEGDGEDTSEAIRKGFKVAIDGLDQMADGAVEERGGKTTEAKVVMGGVKALLGGLVDRLPEHPPAARGGPWIFDVPVGDVHLDSFYEEDDEDMTEATRSKTTEAKIVLGGLADRMPDGVVEAIYDGMDNAPEEKERSSSIGRIIRVIKEIKM